MATIATHASPLPDVEVSHSEALSLTGDLFVREDLSKPENRANVWLLAGTGIEPFWREFSQELGLASESVIRPIQWPGRRPDITVFQGGKPVAVIECERGRANGEQNNAYDLHCGVPVFSILGSGEPQSGTTWARICELALDAQAELKRTGLNQRQAVTLELLVAAINDILGSGPRSAMRWLKRPDELPNSPWLLSACAPLLARPDEEVGAHAAAEGSASIRLRQPKWAINSGRSGLGMAMV